MQRRQFLSTALTATGTALSAEPLLAQYQATTLQGNERLPIAVNQFTCNMFYRRDNIDFWTRLAEIKQAGIDGIEALFDTNEEVAESGRKLADNGLSMYSIYTVGNLHDENVAEKEITRLLEIGEKAKPFGSEIMIYNPAIKRGKSDAELVRQSKNINILGAALKKLGITVAFHYHAGELEFGGREFYHILCATEPINLSYCFEQHWSYRGCGNSQVAMFDHWKLFADRCPIVHFRQSVDDVWSETFGDGDIDNSRLAKLIKKLPKMPYFVLEQAPEEGTPKTMSPVEGLRQSAEYVRNMFE